MRSGFMATAVLISFFSIHAADITVDANAGHKPISPWLYGRNNNLSSEVNKPVSSANWQLYREAGLRMFRECAGNNNTKYNWRKKITSAPDWYNNVYEQDWDFLLKSFLDNAEKNTQALMGFQLIGKVAASKDHNFKDWEYNASQWWPGTRQNLAGGGTVNPSGSDSALKEGDPNLYLMDWPVDSTVGILNHLFGSSGLGYDKKRVLYWNMDNEPEIWFETHDDVMPVNISAEEFMQRYFKVAKLARQKMPEIKLVGFVACNEWQWYSWNNKLVPVIKGPGDTAFYSWIEYFIKRIGEEQKASGVRLLDVLDFHSYLDAQNDAALSMQLHRVWFDTTYVFPQANGCKWVSGVWLNDQKKEYIMERSRRWLAQYCGPNHGVTLGVTECGQYYKNDPSVVAVWYASNIGTFADEGVEIFTPWEWNYGLWEVLHLFSRYGGVTRVASASGPDSMVSAYSSISAAGDSMTIILANRDQSGTKKATVTVNNFNLNGGNFPTLQLNDLQNGAETFKSHADNALKKGSVTANGNKFTIDLPTVSVTAVLLTGKVPVITAGPVSGMRSPTLCIKGNQLMLRSELPMKNATVSLYDCGGRCVRTWPANKCSAAHFSLEGISAGRYVATVNKKAGRPLTFVIMP